MKPKCRRVGMADEADSKSVVGNHVRVQVPPPARNWNTGKAVIFSFSCIFFLCNSNDLNYKAAVEQDERLMVILW